MLLKQYGITIFISRWCATSPQIWRYLSCTHVGLLWTNQAKRHYKLYSFIMIKLLSSFCNFSIFPFQFSTFPFIFLLFLAIFTPFLFFSLPLFSRYRLAEISRSEVSEGALCPPAPCYATAPIPKKIITPLIRAYLLLRVKLDHSNAHVLKFDASNWWGPQGRVHWTRITIQRKQIDFSEKKNIDTQMLM